MEKPEADLNVSLPYKLKLRLKTFCVNHNMTIKEFVALSVESSLNELEGSDEKRQLAD